MDDNEFNKEFANLDLKNPDDVYELMYNFWNKFEKRQQDLETKYRILENDYRALSYMVEETVKPKRTVSTETRFDSGGTMSDKVKFSQVYTSYFN
jgi:hypothetical protein